MAKIAATTSDSEIDLAEKYDEAAVGAAIKKIQSSYRLGQSSLQEHGESLHSKSTGIISAFAAERGLRRDTIERARQFARKFSQGDLRKICRACQEHKFPLGVTLIYRVLPVGSVAECMQLLRKVISEHWNQRQVDAEVRKRTGATTRSGRPRALPKGPAEARQQIVTRFGPGVRWLKDLKSSLNGRLGTGLERKIDKAVIALEALLGTAS